AFCVVSDSGTITEESSLLGFPAVTIREMHERPEGMDSGVLIMSGLDRDSVVQAVHSVTRQSCPAASVSDYANAGSVSRKVLNAILSYTHYVNRTVWYKG
ncbi:UDP-N-acetylglucosamine 2-epimerase (non-hydrolyzing), partial [Candidatus Parcubacteria bacterium]